MNFENVMCKNPDPKNHILYVVSTGWREGDEG
jgi:hypothetical protein